MVTALTRFGARSTSAMLPTSTPPAARTSRLISSCATSHMLRAPTTVTTGRPARTRPASLRRNDAGGNRGREEPRLPAEHDQVVPAVGIERRGAQGAGDAGHRLREGVEKLPDPPREGIRGHRLQRRPDHLDARGDKRREHALEYPAHLAGLRVVHREHPREQASEELRRQVRHGRGGSRHTPGPGGASAPARFSAAAAGSRGSGGPPGGAPREECAPPARTRRPMRCETPRTIA